jgi:hypothetical protein
MDDPTWDERGRGFAALVFVVAYRAVPHRSVFERVPTTVQRRPGQFLVIKPADATAEVLQRWPDARASRVSVCRTVNQGYGETEVTMPCLEEADLTILLHGGQYAPFSPGSSRSGDATGADVVLGS